MPATSSIPLRLIGQRVCFNGRFAWGVKERLEQITVAQGGTIVDEPTDKTNYLVLPDLSAGKGAQKRVMSLNAKGASIAVLTVDDYQKLIAPTPEQVLACLKAGREAADLLSELLGGSFQDYTFGNQQGAFLTLSDQSLDRLDLSHFDLTGLAFDRCRFAGATLNETIIWRAKECDFSKTVGQNTHFDQIEQCRFDKARLKGVQFSSPLNGCSFDGGDFAAGEFNEGYEVWQRKRPSTEAASFRGATLAGANFHGIDLPKSDFTNADLSGALIDHCELAGCDFSSANLSRVQVSNSVLDRSIFTQADLSQASLPQTALNGATFTGANLDRCNLAGARVKGVNFKEAKNFDPRSLAVPSAGQSTVELDDVAEKARQVRIEFKVEPSKPGAPLETLQVSTYRSGQRGHVAYVYSDQNSSVQRVNSSGRSQSVKDALPALGQLYASRPVRFETVSVTSSKSAVTGKALREVAIAAIAEAFGQSPPAADELARLTKAYRDEQKQATSVQREANRKAREEAEKKKEKEKKQIAKKIEKEVGKVTDLPTFLKALGLRADKSKLDKATKMLKADRFQLFNDVSDAAVYGVVKSQTDADLVYACRITHEGHFACCTQNLNICGGLRGSPCKHLLVLIVGLVQAGKLDPSTIDDWVAKTLQVKPELDKEIMGEIFIRYKGAEAGEVDWRPTETLPEDYYAV